MCPGVHQHSDELLDEFDATVIMLGRLMASRITEECPVTSLAGPRLLLLRLLSALGPQKAGELAHNLGIKAPAATSLIDALESEGFVVREHSADDRRVVLVRATPEGLAALETSEDGRRAHMRHVLSVLPEDDVRALIRIQRTLIEAMVERGA